MKTQMDNVKHCDWCGDFIEPGCAVIAIINGDEFCSYDCFNDYAWDYFEAKEQ